MTAKEKISVLPFLPSSETVSYFVMPAEAGIQAVGDNNNSKDLDSRFRGNDGVSLRFDTVSQGGGNFFRTAVCLPSPAAGGG
jgi:hypothetical protein